MRRPRNLRQELNLGSGWLENGPDDGQTEAVFSGNDEITCGAIDKKEVEYVVIKAIQFVEEDPTGTMQLIGTEHGDGPGSYRVLSVQDLGGR